MIRKLVKRHIKISEAEIGKETSIKDGKITIDKDIVNSAVKEDPLCVSLALDVIHPDERHIYTETIMYITNRKIDCIHQRNLLQSKMNRKRGLFGSRSRYGTG